MGSSHSSQPKESKQTYAPVISDTDQLSYDILTSLTGHHAMIVMDGKVDPTSHRGYIKYILNQLKKRDLALYEIIKVAVQAKTYKVGDSFKKLDAIVLVCPCGKSRTDPMYISVVDGSSTQSKLSLVIKDFDLGVMEIPPRFVFGESDILRFKEFSFSQQEMRVGTKKNPEKWIDVNIFMEIDTIASIFMETEAKEEARVLARKSIAK